MNNRYAPILIFPLIALFGCQFANSQETGLPSDEVSNEQLFPIHLESAKEFLISPDESLSKSLKLDEKPIFVWSNPRRAGGQAGHVFLWKDGDRPLALGTIFSFGWQQVPTNRKLVHEWHSLSETKLSVQRSGERSQWQPKAGIKFSVVPGNKAASESAARQSLELRNIARQFEIHSIDQQGTRWPLRVLPAPLATYKVDSGIGALVGWVGDAGSDPELLMLFEPREVAAVSVWHFVPIRMTDHELFVSKDQQLVWESVRSLDDTSFHDKDDLYFRYQDKLVELKQ